MRPDLWPRVTDLIHRALEVPEGDRRAWIEAQAQGDAELAAEVVRLLAANAAADGFLDDPLIADPGAAAALRQALAEGPGETPRSRPPLLSPGQRVGPFAVSDRVGAGGMGEVWRARDSALDRDVAIKVLPVEYSSDADRLRRFEQEARTAGLINHPNILTVHAVGTHAGSPYLVTELLEGETLQERLRGGALPARKAVDLAIQMALGLAAAHDRGIVHRDLKPANLFITIDGRLKILDFGLAKLTQADGRGGDRAASAPGVVVGTAGYMAPEQIRGSAVDHRADLFALGVVLYEMLAGRRAFHADSAVESMHRILTGDPPPIDGVDPSLARVVEHCLEKKPGERFQSARDLAFQLEAILRASDFKTPAGTGLAGSDSAFRSQLRRWLPWAVTAAAVVAAVAALAGGWRLSGSGRPAAALRRFSLPMAEMPLLAEWPPLAISPDGRRVAYVAGGGAPIKVHDLETLATTAVEGTANGFAPFFSPDGQHLGFFTSDALMHVALAGGPPVRVAAAAPVSRGAVWTDDGRIYFSATPSDGIFRVDAGGGRVEPVTELDQSAGEFGHIWPDVAPEGRFLVYVARRGDSFDESRIVARSLRTGLRRTIVEGGTHPRVAEDGRIVFARGETLYAVDIDPDDLTPRKPPEPILRGVQMDPLFGGACYAIARDGTLVYAPGDARPPARSLIWVTAAGAEASAFPEERPFLYPAISADGSAVAITIEGMNQDVWRFDIGRPVLARLTSSHGEDFGAVWSPDGQRLAYTSVRPGHEPAVFVKSADGVDGETLVAGSSFPNAWTTAGDGLIVTVNAELGARSVTGLARVPLTGGKPVGLEPSRFGRYAALLSPDGGHLAFVSLETGRPEVFVARPDSSNARQASVGGGTSPVWARDGRQLFYRSGDAVMAVVVGSGDRPALSAPRLLFRGRYEEPARPDWPRNYDVAPDGRFLMIRPTYSPTVRELIVVLGWRGQRL